MNGRTKSKACLIISIFLLVLACTTAAVRAGTVVFIEQDRFVQADIAWGDPDEPGGGEDHALDSASDYGLFDSTVSVSLGMGWLWSSSSQLSEIVGPSVTASGSAESGGGGTWEVAMSVSSFSLTFDLTAPQEFSIAGSLSADGQSSTSGIRFTSPAGTILDEWLHLPSAGTPPCMKSSVSPGCLTQAGIHWLL